MVCVCVCVCVCVRVCVHKLPCLLWWRAYPLNANSPTTRPLLPQCHHAFPPPSFPVHLTHKTAQLKEKQTISLKRSVRHADRSQATRTILETKTNATERSCRYSHSLCAHMLWTQTGTHTHKHTHTVTKSFIPPTASHTHTHVQSKQKCHSWNNSHFQC